MSTYSLQDIIDKLTLVWKELSDKQKSKIANFLAGDRKNEVKAAEGQMTIDEFLAELEEDYRRKNVQCK